MFPVTRINIVSILREVLASGDKEACNGVCTEYGPNELQRVKDDPFRAPSDRWTNHKMRIYNFYQNVLVTICDRLCGNIPGQLHKNIFIWDDLSGLVHTV